jgi:hypothetical protein
MAKCTASCPLSKHIHRDGGHADCHSYASNHKEGIPHTLGRNPVVNIEAHAEGEDILGETHHGVGFNSLTTMRIDYIGHDTNDAELDTQVNHPQADDNRNWPGLSICKALAPAEKPTDTKCSQKSKNWETKLRLCN